MWFDDIIVEEGPFIFYQRDTSSDVLWGLTTWAGSVWDGTYTNSPSIVAVNNYNDTFIERFRFDTLKGTPITAYWDTTNGKLRMTLSTSHTMLYVTVATSLTAFKDKNESGVQRTISKATLYSGENLYGSDTIAYSLSADGGLNWESVTPNEEHTFTNTGTELLWKVNFIGNGGQDTYLEYIRIKYVAV